MKLQEKPNYVCTCVKHCRVTFFVCYIYLFFFLILKQTIKCKFQMHVKEFALTLIYFFFNAVVNISQPSFSGTDVFGYTSFLAYSTIPDITFYYEFHLKFQLLNHHSALQDNLIFFTGQKGQGKLFYYDVLQTSKYSPCK